MFPSPRCVYDMLSPLQDCALVFSAVACYPVSRHVLTQMANDVERETLSKLSNLCLVIGERTRRLINGKLRPIGPPLDVCKCFSVIIRTRLGQWSYQKTLDLHNGVSPIFIIYIHISYPTVVDRIPQPSVETQRDLDA